MGEVVDFSEFIEPNRYTTDNGIIGVVNTKNNAEIICHGDMNSVLVGNCMVDFGDRKELAEWLWMSVRLVDSEGRWEKSEYVGLNYV